jgi:hypothetical protein
LWCPVGLDDCDDIRVVPRRILMTKVDVMHMLFEDYGLVMTRMTMVW